MRFCNKLAQTTVGAHMVFNDSVFFKKLITKTDEVILRKREIPTNGWSWRENAESKKVRSGLEANTFLRSRILQCGQRTKIAIVNVHLTDVS